MLVFYVLICCCLHYNDLPITKSVASQHPGCFCSCHYKCFSSQMSDITKPKRPHYDSPLRCDKFRNKRRICSGDAFERRRWLKTEKLLIFSWTNNIQVSLANLLLLNGGMNISNILHIQIIYSESLVAMGVPCSRHSCWVQQPLFWGEGGYHTLHSFEFDCSPSFDHKLAYSYFNINRE